MRKRSGKVRRDFRWLLVLAALAAVAVLWTMPEARRGAMFADLERRTALWRQTVEDAVRGLDLPRLALGGDDEEDPRSGGLDARAAPGAGDGGAETQLGARVVGEDEERISPVEIIAGVPTVRLEEGTQEQSGIETRLLREVIFAPEIAAFGRVVDLQPLLSLRGRYNAARYEADVVRTALAASKREYDRLLALNADGGNVATKRLQRVEAVWKRDRAELRRVNGEMAAVGDEARQEWGPDLTGWALDADDQDFARLLARKEVLLLVTLPVGETLPEGTTTVHIARDGGRARAREARYISPAPYTDPVVQGETYFFRTAAGRLRSDMRVDVWVDRSELRASGVIVPQAAVIWATGQSWAYVQIDDEHFVRRAIPTETEAPGGWFVTASVRPGERLVVAGAQMLYAEEFRWQIRDEDEG